MRRETDFVLEKAAWPTMLLETGGRICRANQAARRMFGLDDLPATPLTTIWDDENGGSAIHFLEQQIASETAELKLRLRDGKKTKFIAHVAKVARDGQDYFVLQLFKESGSAFSELAYAPVPKPASVDNKKIPASLLHAGWPVLLVDAHGKIVQANDATASVFGANAEDSALKNLLHSPGEKSGVTTNLKLADGSMAPFRVERCAAGDTKLSLLLCFRTEIHGQPIAPTSATALVSAPVAVPAKSGDDEFLLQNAEWPVLLVHRNGKILRANRAAVRAFGPNVGQENAQLDAVWSSRNRDSARQFLNLPPPSEAVPLKMNLKSGLPGDYWAQYCATGNEEIFLLQLYDAPPRSGDTVMFTAPRPAPVTDSIPAMTTGGEAKGVEPGLAHKQKLDCALQLARSVSLDFNNALTSILGHTSLLLSKTEANHPSRNSLVEIEKSAARAAEIANDLAAFSRQEKDARVQVAGNMNLLLERTVEIFQGSLQTPIVVNKHLERKLFTANFDEAKMQQALVKILENAVEAIKSNGKINIQTRNLELTEATQDRTAKLNPGNYVSVEISDNGAGIAAEVMPQIFEPFFTTKGARHRGLGLAFVYGIVTNHGGGVAVSSQPEVGTTVRLYLPANRMIVRDAPMAEGDLNGTETILIVDDEDLLLTMGRMVLSSFGYTVLTASSGQKALDMFAKSKKKIDLVITDLVMPNMSGRELTEQIQKLAPDTRIIWSSGYVRTANAQEQERYLQKPFTSQDLLRKVKQSLLH